MASRDRSVGGASRTWDFGRDDHPPFSRIFVVHQKGVKEEDFRETFEKYGEIEDIWIVKDKRTGNDKGVTYIKFKKTSEAALAMEEMNGKFLKDNPRPMKVILANSRHEGSARDPNEDVKMLRLFLMVPKHFVEEDIKEKFKDFGKIDYVNIVRHRDTNESKGFAYVKYYRAYHAASALENCDPTFKPIFAEPKGTKRERDHRDDGRGRDYRDDYRGGGGGGGGMGRLGDNMNSSGPGPLDVINNSSSGTTCHLEALVQSIDVNRQNLHKLFDLFPGLDYFDFNARRGMVYVSYVSPACAGYALQKLNGFEYPPNSNCEISVRYAESSGSSGVGGGLGGGNNQLQTMMSMFSQIMQNSGGGSSNNAMQNMIHSMSSMLNNGGGGGGTGSGNAGGGSGNAGGGFNDRNSNVLSPEMYCNFQLPPMQPKAPRDAEIAESLFLVMSRLIPERILYDAFQRFGDLVEIFIVPGKNYGYARYASKDSALKAIECLHQTEIDGQYLKVILADPPRNRRADSPPIKRHRTGDREDEWS